jgi:hypothetical protein
MIFAVFQPVHSAWCLTGRLRLVELGVGKGDQVYPMAKRGGKSRWSLKDERRLLQFASESGSLESLAVELQRSIDSILRKGMVMGLSLETRSKAEPKVKGK